MATSKTAIQGGKVDAERIAFILMGVLMAYGGYLYTKAIDKKIKLSTPSRLVREWILLLTVIIGIIIIRLGVEPKDTPEFVKYMRNVDSCFIAFLCVHIFTRVKRIQQFRKMLRKEMGKDP